VWIVGCGVWVVEFCVGWGIEVVGFDDRVVGFVRVPG
jgi:hypothetical protein